MNAHHATASPHDEGCHPEHTAEPQHDHDAAPIRDPVCGMTVAPDAGNPTAQHDGRTYHFCSSKCRDKFMADPAHYLSGAHRTPNLCRKARNTPVRCTPRSCATHPVNARNAAWRLSRWGACRGGRAESGTGRLPASLPDRCRADRPAADPDHGALRRPGLHPRADRRARSAGTELLLGSPVILWAGWPFFERGVKSVINRSLNMFHPDRPGRRRVLSVQRRGGAGAADLPGRIP